MKYPAICLMLIIGNLFSLPVLAQQTPTAKDLVYAQAGNRKLLLDIYMPAQKDPYLIVWVHGGAWHSGSKENPPLSLLSAGYALASVDYRLSVEASFPAMVYDIKAAIRYLRAHAKQYGYRHDSIIIWGSSAGGHLAALVGTTNNDKELEGKEGNYLNESSSVQLIMDLYGPTDFMTILQQSTPHGISVRAPALALLLGKPVEQVPELARKASPVFQVDASDPPLLILHGDQDNQVPVNQSIELMEAYKKLQLPVQLEFVPGAGHGGPAFNKKWVQDIMENFLKKNLR